MRRLKAADPPYALLVSLAIIAPVRASFEQNPAPLPVSIEIPRGRFYVGQAIEAKVVILAGAIPPMLSLGKSDSMEVVALGGNEVVPRSSTSIGRATETTNLYRYPIRIVARRAGTHALPAIRASVDGRNGAAASRTIAAVAPPASGRTAAFLGGVGRVEGHAEARPDSIRLGESFELRLKLDGPGSIGSAEPPSLAVLGRDGSRWRAEPLAPESVVNPPSRTFRFRVRPDRPGTATIPPFRVATFDPGSSTYQTITTNAVRIRIVDVPNFDASAVAIAPVSRGGTVALAAACAGLAAAGGCLALARWRARRQGLDNPANVAARLIAGLRLLDDEARIGEAVNLALAEYLHVARGRPLGAITPEEARRAIGDLIGSGDRSLDRSIRARVPLVVPDQCAEGPSEHWSGTTSGTRYGQSGTTLAERAANLVAACDRALYADAGAALDSGSVRDDAIALLGELARCVRGEKPREAPGTA